MNKTEDTSMLMIIAFLFIFENFDLVIYMVKCREI